MTNVLILMSDEHNVRTSSVYGHPVVDTPNMARLAREGTVYDAAYCPSPLCAPCRTSFMTGLPVHRHQVYNNCNVDRFDFPTYGSVLQDHGVHSIHIGKTDVHAPEEELGFSEILHAKDRIPPGDTNICRDPLPVARDGLKRADGYGPRDDAFASDLEVVKAAVQWLETRAGTISSPWAMTVQIVAPHFPHVATHDLWAKYDGQGGLPDFDASHAPADHPYAQDLRRYFSTGAFTEEQVRGLRQGYLARVDFVDQQLGRLLDTLEANGLRDDTVVIYTSDHGEMLGRFGMWWKCSMYEDSVRVPLIAAGPGFEPGARIDTPVSLLDVQAAIFAATGVGRPPDWWGSPLQEIEPGDSERIVFAEYHGHGTRSGSFMLRQGDWKLIHNLAAPHQLFNLREDPDELRNLHDDEPAIAGRLDRALRDLCSPEIEKERVNEHIRHQIEIIERDHA